MSQSKQKKIKIANVLVLKIPIFLDNCHPYFGEEILSSHFLDKFCEIHPLTLELVLLD